MPTGGDRGYGVVGYRAALRPRRRVRPTVGGLFAALPATCGHDAAGDPICAPHALFIVTATSGVRVEPAPAIGLAATLSLGVDSCPYPFGMVEPASSPTGASEALDDTPPTTSELPTLGFRPTASGRGLQPLWWRTRHAQ
ncbi:MAG: hypothetical protein JWM10_5204 [Myxococcaceae bacterium]|nr:hypothetical protein [Myxococcaceae bacterium]